ncbi:hypothetical protein Cni_G18474 [Canna indica]|uniref:Uncharacterized protein n=1 Tax=Canna indica TaxID=4628 RepID=A0AAQ3QHL5_9LILI|nr:hypothetical protein Cni_G18474 [Canna indica]
MRFNSGKRNGLGLWKCFCLKNQESAMAAEEAEKKNIPGGRVISCEEDGGVLRLKIVMSKTELKQLLSSMGECCSGNTDQHCITAPQSLGQWAHVFQNRQLKRVEKVKNDERSGWMPALQSIPEEL